MILYRDTAQRMIKVTVHNMVGKVYAVPAVLGF